METINAAFQNQSDEFIKSICNLDGLIGFVKQMIAIWEALEENEEKNATRKRFFEKAENFFALSREMFETKKESLDNDQEMGEYFAQLLTKMKQANEEQVLPVATKTPSAQNTPEGTDDEFEQADD